MPKKLKNHKFCPIVFFFVCRSYKFNPQKFPFETDLRQNDFAAGTTSSPQKQPTDFGATLQSLAKIQLNYW